MVGARDDVLHGDVLRGNARCVRVALPQNQHGAGLGISAALQAYDHAIPNLFLSSQCRFEVLGINIHARGRDDYFFLAALEKEIALLVERAQVAGAIPAFFRSDGLQFVAVPIAAGNAAAPNENFAIFGQLDFASRQNLADGAAAGVERMVQTDQRSGFGQAVALDHGVSQAMPEFLGLSIEGGAAADDGPELPSEPAAQGAESPPAAQKVLAFGSGIARGKALTGAGIFQIAFDLLLQRLDHARDGHQHRDAFAANRRHDFRGVECVLENDSAAQQRGKKDSEELAEDVAQRQQVQETNGMHEPLVLQIFSDFRFDGDEVADHVGVGEHDSLGLSRGAGGEDDFEWVGGLNLRGTKAFGSMLRNYSAQIGGVDGRDLLLADVPDLLEERSSFARTQYQPGAHLRADAACKIGAGGIVDGNSNHPAKRASEESRHPLGTVRTPEQNRVALGDVARLEFAGKLIRHAGDALVAPTLVPVSSRKNVGAVATAALEIVQGIQ